MLGGGRDYFLPSSEGGLRTDGLNLLNISKAEGVTVATTLAEFNAISEMPVLGLFAMSNVCTPSLPSTHPKWQFKHSILIHHTIVGLHYRQKH